MPEDAPGYLLLSAQRALLGQITPNLRPFSVEKEGHTIRTLSVFAEEPTEDEVELTRMAEGLITESVVVSSARPAPRLAQLAYERWEPEG